jgi:hypothetical protein
MAREAAASPDNSIPANKLLVEISKRTHQRNADIAEMAQNYKEQNGTLDAGFDKQVTAYYKKNPLFTMRDQGLAQGHRRAEAGKGFDRRRSRIQFAPDVHAAGRLRPSSSPEAFRADARAQNAVRATMPYVADQRPAATDSWDVISRIAVRLPR